jgi:hypothetical protein
MSPVCIAGDPPRTENWRHPGAISRSIPQIANQTTGCSSMRAAGPAAWPPHPFLKLRAHPFDMLPPCLISFDGDGPTDPLVACQGRYVFPCRPCLRVGCERRPEISRKIMYHSSGDSNDCHNVPSLDLSLRARPPKGSSIRYESATRIQGLSSAARKLTGPAP